ncbi:MAG: sugar phosphate isomerase/epimerase [Clostridia bacterium]|nr:sugar phosphate isomerase/epimerase [Clostridia bacterium]
MKNCVSSYSFGGYVDRLGIPGVIEKAAEMGFEGIEFVEGNWTGGLDKKIAAECRKRAEDKGLTTVSYCIGADFLYGSSGDLNAEVDRIKAQVDFAAELGVKNMRHDVAYGMRPEGGKKAGIGYTNALPRLAEGCRRVTEYAETAGVGTMTENHGYFSQDAARVEMLINTVDHRNFGALVDIGNFMCADEDPAKSVSIMAPYAKHVHCKDFHYKSGNEPFPGAGWFPTRAQNWLRGSILGHGAVPVGQCLRILKAAGYDGWISIEFEGMEDNLTGIAFGLDFLKRVQP